MKSGANQMKCFQVIVVGKLWWILAKDVFPYIISKVSKVTKIRNRYNKVTHLTQGTNGKMTNSQLDTTNESQPFPSK